MCSTSPASPSSLSSLFSASSPVPSSGPEEVVTDDGSVTSLSDGDDGDGQLVNSAISHEEGSVSVRKK